MTRQSLDAVRRTITVTWPQASAEQQKQFLIKTATDGNRKTIVEQASRAGVIPSVDGYANRPGNVDLNSVQLPGPIVFLYDYRKEIAQVGIQMLREASPVQSGKYRDSHVILLNGAEVENLPAKLSPSDVVTLTNPVPYARRIEIGKTKSGRDFVVKVPNRIYERVAKQKLRLIYKNVADIQFTYIELDSPQKHKIVGGLAPFYLLKGQARLRGTFLGAAGTLKRRARRQKVGEFVKAPAIIIRPWIEKVA